MKFRPAVALGVFLAALVLISLSLPAYAAAPSQSIPTNTPEANGNIYYVVQAGNTCFLIASLYGIDDAKLREQNPGINGDCSNLIVGQKLLVGVGGPAAAASFTPGPSPTPAPPTVTPTPFKGTTEICVLLFNDLNGDALREADEPVIVGGAISVTETNGEFSKTLETAINPDPNAYPGVCFTDVPEGNYNVGAAIPDNYNPTMSLTYTLDVKAGDRAFVSFGAQSRDSTVAQPANNAGGGGPSPILGFFGGFLLLGGLGLGWYALRMRNPQSKLKRSGLLKK
jgi:hypothetical protein